MRITNTDFDFVLELNDNVVTSIVCEDPEIFCGSVENLTHLLNDEASKWIISEDDGKKVKPNKIDVIYSPFCFTVNNRRLLNKVYKDFEELINSELFFEKQTVNNKIICMLENAANRLCYNIEYGTDLNIPDILKVYNVSILEDHEGLSEKLSIYMKLMASVLNIECLFLIDIKRYLKTKDIMELYKEAFYQKIKLILLESKYEGKLENENVILIDRQKCIIHI